MDKEFYDKYSKDLECSCCQDLEHCINGKEPLKINCAIHYFKDKIADLEAKLTESEKNLALCEELRNVEENEYSKDISKTNSALLRKCEQTSRLIEENKQLKQQLADKDEEIEDYKKMHWNMQYQHLHELDELSKLTAIDELEKVKEFIRKFVGINDVKFICTTTITDKIDQQINDLRSE